MKKKEYWTVEWSEKQKCFHVDFLKNTIKNGLKDFALERPRGDWKLLGIFDKHEEAHEVCENLRKIRNIPTLLEKFFKD